MCGGFPPRRLSRIKSGMNRSIMSGRLERVSDVIVTELPSEIILLEPLSQEMYALNPTGMLIWKGLPAESLGDLQDRVGPQLHTDRATADRDIERLVAELCEAGLVSISRRGED